MQSMTDKTKIWELISDQLTGEETVEVINDLNKSEELKKEYKELQRLWSLTGAADNYTEEEIEQKLRSFELNTLKVFREKGFRYYFLATLKYAAVFILSFVLSWFLLTEHKNNDSKILSEDLVFETLNKQVAKVTLSDGSVVWLNSSSKVVVPGNFFDSDKRDVSLEGEAFFDVAKDSLKPFIVHTSQGSSVKVLGTKFDIDAYSDEKVVTTLFEGSVEIRNEDKILTVLHPGEQAVYFTTTGNVEISKRVDENTTLWKEDVLTFKDEELLSIIPKLERFYHVKIVVDNKNLNQVRLSGRAFKSYSAEEVLDVFKLVSNIRYKVVTNNKGGKIIHIY